jgi:hypothetical protein
MIVGWEWLVAAVVTDDTDDTETQGSGVVVVMEVVGGGGGRLHGLVLVESEGVRWVGAGGISCSLGAQIIISFWEQQREHPTSVLLRVSVHRLSWLSKPQEQERDHELGPKATLTIEYEKQKKRGIN